MNEPFNPTAIIIMQLFGALIVTIYFGYGISVFVKEKRESLHEKDKRKPKEN